MKKSTKVKYLVLEKTTKIDLKRQQQQQQKPNKKNNWGGGVAQISNIRNKNENITMDPTDVKK